jgi:hypothetical protein
VVVAQEWEGGNGELLTSGHKVSVKQDDQAGRGAVQHCIVASSKDLCTDGCRMAGARGSLLSQ